MQLLNSTPVFFGHEFGRVHAPLDPLNSSLGNQLTRFTWKMAIKMICVRVKLTVLGLQAYIKCLTVL